MKYEKQAKHIKFLDNIIQVLGVFIAIFGFVCIFAFLTLINSFSTVALIVGFSSLTLTFAFVVFMIKVIIRKQEFHAYQELLSSDEEDT